MIDFSSDSDIVAPASKKHPGIKVLVILLLVALAGGTFWVLWLFLSPSRTIALQEGRSYTYGGYVFTLQKASNQFCPDNTDDNCRKWLFEDGVQISYTNSKINGIVFAYVGLSSQPILDLDDIKIQLISSDAGNKTAKLKLIKK